MSENTEKQKEELRSNFDFKRKPRIKPDMDTPVVVGVGNSGIDIAKTVAMSKAVSMPMPIIVPKPTIIVPKPGDWVKAEITGTLIESKVGADGRNLHKVELIGSGGAYRFFEDISLVDTSLETKLKEYGMTVMTWYDETTFYGFKNGTNNMFKIFEGHKKSAFLRYSYKGKDYSLLIPNFIKTVGAECILKGTGHVGKITKELVDSWGVYWYGGIEGNEHAKKIKEYGLPTHWQDKSKIEIIIP